jgi:hypothetical protein
MKLLKKITNGQGTISGPDIYLKITFNLEIAEEEAGLKSATGAFQFNPDDHRHALSQILERVPVELSGPGIQGRFIITRLGLDAGDLSSIGEVFYS